MSDHVNKSLQFALQAIRDEATKPLHIEIEALAARCAELEANLLHYGAHMVSCDFI